MSPRRTLLFAILIASLPPASRAFASFSRPVFAREEVYEALIGVHDIVAGDFDGDAKLDLAVTNSFTEHNGSLGLTIYYSEGQGGFGRKQDYPTNSRPFGAAAADFNGDGVTDVAVATYYAREVAVRYGTLDGVLSPSENYQVEGSPWSIAVGDFLGDERLDIATNHYDISLLEGVTGAFRPSQLLGTEKYGYANLVAADVTRDGRLDLLLTTGSEAQVQLLPSRPEGGFESPQYFDSGPDSDALAVGDLNGDGWMDLVVGNWSLRMVRTLMGQPGGGFLPGEQHALPRYPRALELADLNNDSHLDLIVSATENASGFLSVLFNGGDGSLDLVQSIPIYGEAQGIVAADFDGNGFMDVAVTASATQNYQWSVGVFYNGIPEPSAFCLLAAGSAGIMTKRRRAPRHDESQSVPSRRPKADGGQCGRTRVRFGDFRRVAS